LHGGSRSSGKAALLYAGAPPLQSSFFYERTLRSLTYSAPFAASLACTGLGFLLIMNRMVEPETFEWAQWVLLLALGGFVGNFVFSLSDHVENGFFYPMEWVPVVASAGRFVSINLAEGQLAATRRRRGAFPIRLTGASAFWPCSAPHDLGGLLSPPPGFLVRLARISVSDAHHPSFAWQKGQFTGNGAITPPTGLSVHQRALNTGPSASNRCKRIERGVTHHRR
jgi:hypothetical protein